MAPYVTYEHLIKPLNLFLR